MERYEDSLTVYFAKVVDGSFAEMIKTDAEQLREEGWEEGRKEGEITARRQVLAQQLSRQIGDIPLKVLKRINHTKDIRQLDVWLERVLKAKSWKDMEIG